MPRWHFPNNRNLAATSLVTAAASPFFITLIILVFAGSVQAATSGPVNVAITVTNSPGVSLKNYQTTGSMSAGSNQLTLAGSNPGFKAGDPIIVEIGTENVGVAPAATYVCSGSGINSKGNAGLPGSVGVGGVWPQKCYTTVAAMNADTSQAAGTFAWVVTDATSGNGSVYQWNSPSWSYFGNVLNYYFNKAIPRALVTTISSVSGTTFTLDPASGIAAASTTNANVYYDNAPYLNSIWNGALNTNYTYIMPSGSYAIGSEIDAVGGSSTSPLNSTISGQGGYPTCSTTLFSPKGATSATINANVYTFTFSDFCMTGNVRKASGYGPDWNAVSETSININSATERGIYLDPSPNTTIKNMTFRNTWAGPGSELSDNVTVTNINYILDDAIQVEQWGFDFADGTTGNFSNLTLTSNGGLTFGFECFQSASCNYTNITTTNGIFSLNGSGPWKIQGLTTTITANSAQLNIGANSGEAIVVDCNQSCTLASAGGQINNAQITIQGYLDAAHDQIQGIVVNGTNSNVSIDADGSSSTYRGLSCGAGAAIGALAVNASDGAANLNVKNMTATGAGCNGQTNFELSSGVGQTCHNLSGSVSGITCN